MVWVVIVVIVGLGVLAVVLSACAMASRVDEINNLNPDDEAAAWAVTHHSGGVK